MLWRFSEADLKQCTKSLPCMYHVLLACVQVLSGTHINTYHIPWEALS